MKMQSQRQKEQSQVTEEGHLHPILLSDEKEKSSSESEQKLQELLRNINDETL